MSKRAKILLGLPLLWPVAPILLFLFPLFLYHIDPMTWFLVGTTLSLLWFCVMLLTYSILATKNKALTGGEKALWIVLFLVASELAWAAYWYLYVWREPTPLQLHAGR